MAALIRCVLHIDPFELSDKEFYRAFQQVRFFMKLAYGTKFPGDK